MKAKKRWQGIGKKVSDASEPEDLGLMLLGAWRESPAAIGAYGRGSIVVDEGKLCRTVGCTPNQLDDYLRNHWYEHKINATADGTGPLHQNNVSLVRQHDGYFTVRLFSPRDEDSAIVQRLRSEGAVLHQTDEGRGDLKRIEKKKAKLS